MLTTGYRDSSSVCPGMPKPLIIGSAMCRMFPLSLLNSGMLDSEASQPLPFPCLQLSCNSDRKTGSKRNTMLSLEQIKKDSFFFFLRFGLCELVQICTCSGTIKPSELRVITSFVPARSLLYQRLLIGQLMPPWRPKKPMCCLYIYIYIIQ